MLIAGEDDSAILAAEDKAIIEAMNPPEEPLLPVADDLAELLKVAEVIDRA